MNIIVTGNPSDGFHFIGPFANGLSATEYIIKYPREIKGDFWIVPLSNPRSHPEFIVPSSNSD